MPIKPESERSKAYWLDFQKLNGAMPYPSDRPTPAEAARVILEMLDELDDANRRIKEQAQAVDDANRRMKDFAEEVSASLASAVRRCKALTI